MHLAILTQLMTMGVIGEISQAIYISIENVDKIHWYCAGIATLLAVVEVQEGRVDLLTIAPQALLHQAGVAFLQLMEGKAEGDTVFIKTPLAVAPIDNIRRYILLSTMIHMR